VSIQFIQLGEAVVNYVDSNSVLGGGTNLAQTASNAFERQPAASRSFSKTRTQGTLPGIPPIGGAPFLKWAGGKGQLLGQLDPYFPKKFNRYFEPFAGSAAVFFHLGKIVSGLKATLIDSNEELINCFTVVRDNFEELVPKLRSFQEQHGETFYYKMRGEVPSALGAVQRAARFIYLNKTCYNGLYRVNRKGVFNVPIGSYSKPKIFDEDNLRAASIALEKAKLIHGHFSAVLKQASDGDFVYFDPPYYTETNGFTGYAVSASGNATFGAFDHRMLLNCVEKLNDRGCTVVISNSNTKFIRDLYENFKRDKVTARRFINCNGSGRQLVNELVITN